MMDCVEQLSKEPAAIESHRPGHGLRAESALDPKVFAAIRRRVALEGCKWDSQVGDVTALASFPLVMKRSIWDKLAAWAERLTLETTEAEKEILGRLEFLEALGLPRALQQILADDAPVTPTAGRVIRFDFHFTTDGWRISEANSDVPGGFSEASHFTALMAENFPDLKLAGNPGAVWSDTLAVVAGPGRVVALLFAPGYMEDCQVVSFLAARLRERGCVAHLAKPEQICWHEGRASLSTSWHSGPLDAIVRFYQAEWLARLHPKVGWSHLFRGGRTPTANPASAVISESKRFPLVWDKMKAALPTWRALLPETRDPCNAPWPSDDCWLVKSAMCNTGDTVSIRSSMPRKQWLQTRLRVSLSPHKWVAQRRFESVPVSTPIGPRHFCVGVYTVNGRAAGAYVRISEKPLIDFEAVDVALLIEEDD
jgi:glutathionylspermidine synthase